MESLSWVQPVKPVAPYIGGKAKLADRIVTMINQIPHATYAECFVGMGGVFLRRDRRPKCEVINDYGRDVANFFRVLQRHYQAFMDMLKWQIASRAEFARLMQTDPMTLTDLERAARFLYLQRLAYGGKASQRAFGVQTAAPSRFDMTKLASMLEDVHDRLGGVTIECLDYKDFIERYDHEDCLFYLDPPYHGCENDYGKGLFHRGEFTAMAQLLGSIKGKFILSINDVPEIRETFAAFRMIEVETEYSIGPINCQVAKELLITNCTDADLDITAQRSLGF